MKKIDSNMEYFEMPLGAKDSELKGWEYIIPEGMEAEIKDGKIVVREKKPELTEFEESLRQVIVSALSGETPTGSGGTMSWAVALSDDDVRKLAPRLLELAKKEICKGCTVGLEQYWKGYKGAKERFEKLKTFYYPMYDPPCFLGGICADHIRDCINCSRTTGDISTSTTSGTCKKD